MLVNGPQSVDFDPICAVPPPPQKGETSSRNLMIYHHYKKAAKFPLFVTVKSQT